MSNAIKTWERNGRLVVQFVRPETRNPLSVEVLNALQTLLEADPAVEVIVFTGSDGVFASGADLREIRNIDRSDAIAFAQRGQSLMKLIAGAKPTTIAAIDGPCFGGALDLALACDQRIASPRATFCHPGVGLGIITGWGGSQKLPRLVGEGTALELFFTAAPITAGTALRIGLVDKVVPDPLDEAINS